MPTYQIGRYGLTLLMLAYLLCYLDRQIVNILAELIKKDLGISDKQLGLLTGLSFAILYTTMGIPMGRLAERVNRVRFIGASVFAWSGFTTLCGFAQSFGQLFLARIGVGLGEAGCLPAAHSMISSYTPRERLARAISVFMMGSPLGVMLGMVIGGLVADAVGWRASFLVAGIPGILLTVVVLSSLKDPQRDRHMLTNAVAQPSLADTLRVLAGRRSFWLLTAGAAIGGAVNYAQGAFIASFFLRNYSAELAELSTLTGATGALGILLGLVVGLGGAIGVMLGGVASDRLGQKAVGGPVQGYMTVAITSCLLVAPLFAAAVMVKSFWLSLALMIPASILTNSWFGPIFAATQSIVPAHSRATGAAISLCVISLVGLGLGPLSVGSVSDWLGKSLGSAEGLRWALVTSTLFSFVAAGFFRLTQRSHLREGIA